MSTHSSSGQPSEQLQQVVVLSSTGEKDFFMPPLDDYHPPRFPLLAKTPELAERVRTQRLLFLAGDPTLDKHALARHLAWYLGGLLEQEPINGGQELEVQEWKRSGSQNVNQVLEQFDDPTIFILPQLLPQHINYDLPRLCRLARNKHYIIATIDEETGWHNAIDQRERSRVWCEMIRSEIYSPRDLQTFLLDRLFEDRTNIHPDFVQEARKIDGRLGAQAIDSVVTQLKTPENIDAFVQLLGEHGAKRRPSDEVIAEYIVVAQDDERRVRQWYNSLPGTREQLLVLALNFFDGLTENQFFAAVDELVEQMWHRREPLLRALDYCDLEQLGRFYSQVMIGDKAGFKTKLPNQRYLILRVAWRSHRRHIVGALPIFANYVHQSVRPHGTENLPLFGNKGLRDQLRKTLSETISDIGLQDAGVVEEALLRLAVNHNIGVQAVAARAIARWREYGATDKALAMLTRWMKDSTIAETIDGFNAEQLSHSEEPATYLKATIALTVGYAAQADPPDMLQKELYALLSLLVKDTRQLVLQYLCSYTLPLILPLHVKQVRRLVQELALRHELHDQIARSFAQAFASRSTDVEIVLERWYNESTTAAARTLRGKDAEARETLLACVCTIYGRLATATESGAITDEGVFKRMRAVLARERAAVVRKAALAAILLRVPQHFPELQDIVPTMTASETQEAIRALTEVYLNQRENLQGGEATIRIAGHIIPIWLHRKRPLTSIEVEMNHWVKDHENTVAQQVAVQALIAFRRVIAEAERQRIEEMRRGHRRPQAPPTPTPVAVADRRVGLYPHDWYLYYVVPFFVTLNAPRLCPIIRGVLPEVIQQDITDPILLYMLLGEWTRLSDNDMAELGQRLQWAILLVKQRTWVLLIMAAAIVLPVLFCGVLTAAWR